MQWSKQAKEALFGAPVFVRRRITRRVEEEAMRGGDAVVGIEHVHACQKRFLNKMEDEIKGYRVETCFGTSGCPNRSVVDDQMAHRLDRMFLAIGLKAFLKERVAGPLKMHHEFRVSISDCPNACSRPQIADVGLIGACRPAVFEEPCTHCGSCVETCREGAVHILSDQGMPVINPSKCLSCGACVAACPSGTIEASQKGYRILLGGKLGRHPKLGKELGKIYSSGQTIEIVHRCLKHYLDHNQAGERFGDILDRTELTDLSMGGHDA